MTPEQKAREAIDQRLIQAGWILQDMCQLNPMAGPGVAVREFPTSTGPVDYALFVDGIPVGVVEAKADEKGENITTVEGQSSRYAGSTFKWVKAGYRIRFAYEATGKLTRFTDYNDQKYRSRRIFSFHRPESLRALLKSEDIHGNAHPRTALIVLDNPTYFAVDTVYFANQLLPAVTLRDVFDFLRDLVNLSL